MSRAASIVVDNFADFTKHCRMPIIAVYKSPIDYPNKYVARLWDLKSPTKYIMIADNLYDIRVGIPQQMARIEPAKTDDPIIVETWL